jgi:hypothetical protein
VIPDAWLGIETHSGDLRVVAACDGRRVEVWFRGNDVADLKRHVDHALAQQKAKR